jgi:hypothetical protein
MMVALVTNPFICNALSMLVMKAKAPEAVDPSSSPRSPDVLSSDSPCDLLSEVVSLAMTALGFEFMIVDPRAKGSSIGNRSIDVEPIFARSGSENIDPDNIVHPISINGTFPYLSDRYANGCEDAKETIDMNAKQPPIS